jgi:hypothetical protein
MKIRPVSAGLLTNMPAKRLLLIFTCTLLIKPENSFRLCGFLFNSIPVTAESSRPLPVNQNRFPLKK